MDVKEIGAIRTDTDSAINVSESTRTLKLYSQVGGASFST